MFFIPFIEELDFLKENEIIFQKLSNENLKSQSNPLFKIIYDETSKIYQ